MLTKLDHDVYNDSVASFMLSENVRGRFARVNQSLNHILAQHKYPEKVSRLMAEAILLTVMIGQAIKLKWKLSVQIRGSGSIRLIAVDYFSPNDEFSSANIRAYAKFDFDAVENAVEPGFHLLGKGLFAVLIDQGEGTKPYQGLTPLAGESLADCAETYFDQSEQLPTSFKIIVGQSDIASNNRDWRGGGIMLQQLPNIKVLEQFNKSTISNPKLKKNNLKQINNCDFENWSRANILMNTIEELELVGPQLAPIDILKRLFHQEALRVFEPQKLIFGCSCSIEKVSRTLSIYSSKDIKSMMTKEGTVTADCQFCSKHYVLDPNKLGFESEG